MARPRVLKKGRCYNPSAKNILQVKRVLLAEMKERGFSLPLFKGEAPISLRIVFTFPRPNSHFTAKDRNHLRNNAPALYKVAAPDLDNLDKLVMDAANGILYDDDSQVVSMKSTKVWAGDNSKEGSTKLKVKIAT
jgi:Holliday junction resolvase RusA-like endonuclease